MNEFTNQEKILTKDEIKLLNQQNTRLVPPHKANLLEIEAKKHWDLFYKRNETRFFKDRHWTTREFQELIDNSEEKRNIIEIGCGVGNLIYPLIEDGLNFNIFACDLSPRAIEFVKSHELYNLNVHAFQADITKKDLEENVGKNSMDIATLIFVLSAIHPDKFKIAIQNIYEILKPGGILLFRDYGLYDMAQLRFKAGHKISENFYMRQDGTRSYYFSTDFAQSLFEKSGFKIISNGYVHRRTINKKENIDVPRIFIQAKLQK